MHKLETYNEVVIKKKVIVPLLTTEDNAKKTLNSREIKPSNVEYVVLSKHTKAKGF